MGGGYYSLRVYRDPIGSNKYKERKDNTKKYKMMNDRQKKDTKTKGGSVEGNRHYNLKKETPFHEGANKHIFIEKAGCCKVSTSIDRQKEQEDKESKQIGEGPLLLIGGGTESSGEQGLAKEIMAGVQRAQLPMKLDTLTEGDGNCFFRSIWSQLQREEIRNSLSSEKSRIKDHDELRKKVAKFMTRTRNLTVAVENFIQNYKDILQPVTKETWGEYWARMRKDKEWADDIAVQGTAWYLNQDILIVWSTATLEKPYLTKSGSYLSEITACQGLPLLVGYVQGIHYQSLLPSDDPVYRPNICQPQCWEDIWKDMVKCRQREEGSSTSDIENYIEDEPGTSNLKRKSNVQGTEDTCSERKKQKYEGTKEAEKVKSVQRSTRHGVELKGREEDGKLIFFFYVNVYI